MSLYTVFSETPLQSQDSTHPCILDSIPRKTEDYGRSVVSSRNNRSSGENGVNFFKDLFDKYRSVIDLLKGEKSGMNRLYQVLSDQFLLEKSSFVRKKNFILVLLGVSFFFFVEYESLFSIFVLLNF